jgi:hypothetical protein
MPVSINNYRINNKEKDGENGDNTSNSNKNAIAVNVTPWQQWGVIERNAIVDQQPAH